MFDTLTDPENWSPNNLRGFLQPIILDLNGDGIEITTLSESTVFMAGKDGLDHNIAWAAAGDGVLFYDPDGTGEITELRQYVFTEWDPTASSDIEALANVFDSNGDGVFDANDAEWANFKVMVTNADGSQSAVTLASLGIVSIDLDVDATNIELPDGSVITGQTTFTYTDGSTGLVGDVTLVADSAGYDVEEVVSTDANGNRVVEQTGYAADGSVAFVLTSVTAPDGSSITNSYDLNGDGVVDEIQVISVVTTVGVETVRSVSNYTGNDLATAVLQSVVVTTTSSDGSSVVIERDSVGGGWYDQVETRDEQPDGSWINVISDLSEDGTVISSITETVSVDGLTRVEDIDQDGDGVADLTIEYVISIDAVTDVRTEVTTYKNADGTIRSVKTETISADGKTKTVSYDVDSDQVNDAVMDTTITVNADGSTTSTMVTKNHDGDTVTSSTQTQSADALTKTIETDLDGDGDVDVKTVDQTTIHGDASRTREVTVTNEQDSGAIRSKTKEFLGADKITAQSWVDLGKDGVFDATDLVRDVTVDSVTGEVTAIDYIRNDDGTIQSTITTLTSADGLTLTRSVDSDGDGDVDTEVVEDSGTWSSGDGYTKITTKNADGSKRNEVLTNKTPDGLETNTRSDFDGDGNWDSIVTTEVTQQQDGGYVEEVSQRSGDWGIISEQVTTVSADRNTTTVTQDDDNDGNVNFSESRSVAADGSVSTISSTMTNNGVVTSQSQSTVSADGLNSTVQMDADGDGIFETVRQSSTVLNGDGSQTTTTVTTNGDGSERSRTVEDVSDDGLTVTVQLDADGDGVFERKTVTSTVTQSNGDIVTVTDVLNPSDNDSLITRTQTELSDDGLVLKDSLDTNGDGVFDLTTVSTTVLLDDGGTETTVEVRGADGTLRSSSKTTTSDDGDNVTIETDIDGDGVFDQIETRDLLDTGEYVVLVQTLSGGTTVESQMRSETSDDGLVVKTFYDADGDGVFETEVTTTTQLNLDGTSVTVTETKDQNGSVIEKTTQTSSDDGWSETYSEDWNNDGKNDVTYTSTYSVASDGTSTDNTTLTAADGSTLETSTTTVSADGRSETVEMDIDGNGQNDYVATSVLDDDGVTTVTTEFFTKGGIKEAGETTVISEDGLTAFTELDRNGDGETDLFTTDITDLAADGSISRAIEYRDDRYDKLASEEHVVSDDGLTLRTALDLDGDDWVDFETEEQTSWSTDGSVNQSVTTRDAVGNTIAARSILTSGDGLSVVNTLSVEPEGIDRVVTTNFGADGGYTETSVGTGTDTEIIMSPDGRSMTMSSDFDSDGSYDQLFASSLDADQATTIEISDLDADGNTTTKVTAKTSSNGMEAETTIDVDGDGSAELLREQDIQIDADGNEIVTLVESYADGSLAYKEVKTISADGLRVETLMDQDGDGQDDGRTVTETTLNDDGSQSVLSETRYLDDNSLRTSWTQEISSDGRHIVTERDYDGNGIIDKRTELVIRSDGEEVLTETTFSEAGMPGVVWVTTTSADGLHQTIVRDGNAQTITRSPIDNGTYTWDNGGSGNDASDKNVVVTHEVSADGIETWTLEERWVHTYTETYTSGENDNQHTQIVTENKLNATKVTLGQETKARIISEAEAIYDTMLDRGMDFVEFEYLIEHIKDGELDKEGLVKDLRTSGEFNVRYGSNLSDAEFVNQLFLNTYGRTPTLEEYASSVAELDNGSSRDVFAVDLAESAEHLFVGNTHRSTNNYDVLMNPAQFERLLDRTVVEEKVANLIDAMFDRDPTEYEMEHYSERLLEGTDNPSDLVADMMTLTDDTSSSVVSLAGAQFINQVFVNAIGRSPTTEELANWVDLLDSNAISKDDFVVAVATSAEADAIGNGHHLSTTQTHASVTGTANGETLNGTSGNDVIEGGLGYDIMNGGTGSDTYLWSKNDGGDQINDTSTSLSETDRLVFSDVDPSDVELRHGLSGDDLQIRVISTGEVISVDDWFSYASNGRGIEEIEFADGTIWTVQDILAETVVGGTSGNDSINGYDKDETFLGWGGDDTINAKGGDDTLEGGYGDDTLKGGEGEDTYVWSLGHGNDTIDDSVTSITDIDTLKLDGVSVNDVNFERSNGDDLLIRIVSDGSEITIKDQFDGNENGAGRSVAFGKGIEKIVFADAVWTLEDIYNATSITGDNTSNTLDGTDLHDNISGLDGADTLKGHSGDDTLVGGLGNDVLQGGWGSDTYIWSKGDGDDRIDEDARSLTETDILVLSDVSADDVKLNRLNGDDDLYITVVSTGEVIEIDDRFNTTAKGFGVEEIHFADGSVWTWQDIQARTKVEGDDLSNSLSGRNGRDNLYGYDGDDTLDGKAGDDKLVGGEGTDTLIGGDGNDLYIWSKGDGDDYIDDEADSFEETDTLRLTDVTQTEATLSISGDDLFVAIGSETIQIEDRFASADRNEGVEVIAYSDGVITEVLASEDATLAHTGSIGSDTINGWVFADTFDGGDGNDTLDGKKGDDTFVGGGGNDTLIGGEGSDTYHWKYGDGNDDIDERSANQAQEIDTLYIDLSDVPGASVELFRSDTGDSLEDNLFIRIQPSLEVIHVYDFFHANTTDHRGIEKIALSDGTVWGREEIEELTQVWGDSGNNTLDGLNQVDDNIYGWDGNDTIDGKDGDDTLIGGLGNDDLIGGNGSDTYRWSLGDGTDEIRDQDGSGEEIDTLELVDVNSTDVDLTRANGTDWLFINIHQNGVPTGQTINVVDQFENNTKGIEKIVFADGVVWDADEIAAQTKLYGTSGDDSLSAGGSVGTTLYGYGGNDTLTGNAGDDLIVGGTGNDQLFGAGGNDTYKWSLGDGTDEIRDQDGSGEEIDTLQLADINPTDVGLTRASGSDWLFINIHQNGVPTGQTINVVDQFENNTKGIEKIVFADGTVWDADEIAAQTKLHGSSGNDSLSAGGSVGTTIYGYGGNDDLNGNGGDDILIGGSGADDLDGNGGSDWASYETSTTGVTARLDDQSSNTGDAAGDIYQQIENLRGSNHTDTLYGDSAANKIEAGDGDDFVETWSGDDVIYGGAGNDGLHAGSGDDIVYGEGGDDYITGWTGDDMLVGGDGDDVLIGGSGADILDGGNGSRDEASYAYATASVTVDLENEAANLGDATGDIYIDIEDIAGSSHSDNLFGDASSNKIVGNDGSDVLFGRDGNDHLHGGKHEDRLEGGKGDDFLDGGEGADTFIFADGDGFDQLNTFSDGEDKMEFTSIGLSFADLTITQDGDDALITYSYDGAEITGQIRLSYVDSSLLTADDFIFA
ncbi:MAG: calcium-binding protein [Pseudomonadota bacterium]